MHNDDFEKPYCPSFCRTFKSFSYPLNGCNICIITLTSSRLKFGGIFDKISPAKSSIICCDVRPPPAAYGINMR